MLIWMKQTVIWFNLHKNGTGNGFSNTNDTFAKSLLVPMSALHQSMCIFKGGLSSHVHMMAVQNMKKNYLICQIPVIILKQHATQIYITKRFTHQKGAEKLVKDKLYVCIAT